MRGKVMSKKYLRKIFKEYKGIMKTSELYANGISKYEIKKLVHMMILERISKGYYKLTSQDISDIGIVMRRLPEAVICFDTALFFYGYSDRTPFEIHIAVDKDISKAKVKFDYPSVKPYYVEPYLLSLGVEKIKIDDTEVKIYTRDRLICDCLKYEKKMEIELFNKAITSYIKDPKKNISKLMEYAKIRRVEKKVYDKIGTWL